MVNVHQEHRDWQPHGWLDQPVAGQPVEVQGDDKSLMVIAPAVNFLHPIYADILKKVPQEARFTLDR